MEPEKRETRLPYPSGRQPGPLPPALVGGGVTNTDLPGVVRVRRVDPRTSGRTNANDVTARWSAKAITFATRGWRSGHPTGFACMPLGVDVSRGEHIVEGDGPRREDRLIVVEAGLDPSGVEWLKPGAGERSCGNLALVIGVELS